MFGGLFRSASAAAPAANTGAAAAATALPTGEQMLALAQARRSVYPRDFSGDPIPRAKLEAMLEAARWAPTHRRTEPWRFVVLAGSAKAAFEELTIRLCGDALEGEKRDATLVKLARKQGNEWKKVYCYVAIGLARHADKVPEWEELAAVAAAVQNMQLTAAALGGVACYWSSWQEAAREAGEMRAFLGLNGDAGDRCLGVLVAGVPVEGVGERVRGSRKPLDDKVAWRLD